MRRAAALLAFAGSSLALSEEYVRGNGPLLWAQFKKEHQKEYAADEEASRYGVFMQNMIEAARLERENPRATFGASKFADLTKEEFKAWHNLKVPSRPSPATRYTAAEVSAALATSVDWRKKGAVTQVKNQAQCGSCWAFSSTGGIEGQWFLAGNKLTSVSEQELVSCDKVDQGCNGGLMDNAYSWLVSSQKGNIVTESAYPYTSGGGDSGSCKSLTGMSVGATITGHKDIAHSEAEMATYVSQSGPLPIAVDAASHWQTYTGGIVSSCTGTSLDHGVLIVGYTPQYWVVKNSWGSSWGESGYIRLAYGSNQCGLNQSPTAPIASGAGPVPPSPPSPPSPPTPPTPPSPSGTFTQKQCSDSACSSGCASQSFPIGQCLQVSGGGSAIVQSCDASSGMTMKMWLLSADCSGSLATTQQQPVDQCLQDAQGGYFENECSTTAAAAIVTTGMRSVDVTVAAFAAYKAEFAKWYSAEEEPKRFAAFQASIVRVRKSGSSTHGFTKFSDLTPEEFKATYLGRRAPSSDAEAAPTWDGVCTACKRFPELKGFSGDSFDWTTKGAVTPVKDQGQCGSCWSFGTTGDIEGVWYLSGHDMVSLSEQELVSCEKQDQGCGGGLQEDAFPWVIKQGGIVAEKTYPYKSGGGSTGTCQTSKEKPVAAKISKWYQVSKSAAGEADILKQLAQVGPITIGINAGPMQDYTGGVDDPWLCRASSLDHAVLIVGYGTDNGVDYWKIKNSWNTDWGEKGYYRIVRGKNKCGVAMDAVHSVV